MSWKLVKLCGACVLESGAIANRRGERVGLRISPGGYLIFDEADQIVGTLTMAGRVYDCAGRLVTQIERHDLSAARPDPEPLRALEVGLAWDIR